MSLSLSTFMVLILVVGGVLGWVARRERIQGEAVAAIERAGGRVLHAPMRARFEVDIENEYRYSEAGVNRSLGGPWPTWFTDWIQAGQRHEVTSVRLADVDRAVLAEVGKLDRLETLSLDGSSLTDEDLAGLRGLTGLRFLMIRTPGLTGAGLTHLKDLTGLEVLQISRIRPSDAEMAALSGLTRLDSLSIDPRSLTDAGLTHLAGLSRLKHLRLTGSQVTTAGLGSLAKMTAMTRLWLDGTRVDDLAPIGKLTSLWVLSVEGCPIGDRGLAPIRAFTSIQDLNLSGTKVTDAGFALLDHHASLSRLAARHSAITDVGFAGLTGLTALDEVDLFEARTTSRGKRAFLKKYPKVKVTY